MNDFTIFTQSIPSIKDTFNPAYYKKIINKIFRTSKKRGPSGVLRSLIQGLNLQEKHFSINPKKVSQIASTVIVLSNIKALQQSILLKKKGHIKTLLAGPNLVINPTEHNSIITSPEIDCCIVPSEWIKNIYEQETPSLKGRIAIWPAGVDSDFWKPTTIQKSKKVLIYWKTEEEQFIKEINKIVKKHDYDPVVLKYGDYTEDEYKKALDESIFAIFVSSSESQGIALLEAWSMNVRTLVWNPKERIILGKKYSNISSAPYLTKYTGKDWQKLSELDNILKNRYESEKNDSRSWVLKNMTDKHSSKILLNIINKI